MPSYWLIKAILILGFIALAFIIVRPVRTENRLALRRLGTLILIIFACFSVIFPGLLNRLAAFIGVDRGINLLVYALVLTVFSQMATAYRRDLENNRKLTALARAIALKDVQYPSQSNDSPPLKDH